MQTYSLNLKFEKPNLLKPFCLYLSTSSKSSNENNYSFHINRINF